jgi:hypothetical protein
MDDLAYCDVMMCREVSTAEVHTKDSTHSATADPTAPEVGGGERLVDVIAGLTTRRATVII